jgi:hypothetical protein
MEWPLQVFWKGHQYASAKDKIANIMDFKGPIVRPDDLDSEEGEGEGEEGEGERI